MTEAAPRRTRWSKGQLRVIAWLSAGLAFLLSGTAIAMAPKPPMNDAAHERPRPTPRKTIVKHRVVRRVVYDPPVSTGGSATVYTASSGSSSSGSTTTTSTSSGGSSGSTGSSGSAGSSGSSGGSSGGTSSGGTTTTTTGGS